MLKKYLLGTLLNFFHPGVSLLTMIDTESVVSRKGRVYPMAKLFRSRVGDYSYICQGTQLTCAEVGKFCSVATGCLIGLAAHHLRGLSTSPVFTERDNPTGFRWTEAHEEDVLRPVSIGNDVWIGARVIVLGGVTIGNGAVIGAGSVVTRDVPPYAVVAGTPARLIRYPPSGGASLVGQAGRGAQTGASVVSTDIIFRPGAGEILLKTEKGKGASPPADHGTPGGLSALFSEAQSISCSRFRISCRRTTIVARLKIR